MEPIDDKDMSKHPSAGDAKHLAVGYEKDIVIIIGITRRGQISYANYGINKIWSAFAYKLSNVFVQLVQLEFEKINKLTEKKRIIVPQPGEEKKIIDLHKRIKDITEGKNERN